MSNAISLSQEDVKEIGFEDTSKFCLQLPFYLRALATEHSSKIFLNDEEFECRDCGETYFIHHLYILFDAESLKSYYLVTSFGNHVCDCDED